MSILHFRSLRFRQAAHQMSLSGFCHCIRLHVLTPFERCLPWSFHQQYVPFINTGRSEFTAILPVINKQPPSAFLLNVGRAARSNHTCAFTFTAKHLSFWLTQYRRNHTHASSGKSKSSNGQNCVHPPINTLLVICATCVRNDDI